MKTCFQGFFQVFFNRSDVVTKQLICVFVFTHAKSRFSHDAAQMLSRSLFCPQKTAEVGTVSYPKHAFPGHA